MVFAWDVFSLFENLPVFLESVEMDSSVFGNEQMCSLRWPIDPIHDQNAFEIFPDGYDMFDRWKIHEEMAFNRTKQKNVFLEVVSEIRNHKGFGELYYLLDILMHDIDRVAIVDQSEVALVIEEIFAVLAQLWLYFL